MEAALNKEVMAWLDRRFSGESCVRLAAQLQDRTVKNDAERWGVVVTLLLAGGFSRREAMSCIPFDKQRIVPPDVLV